MPGAPELSGDRQRLAEVFFGDRVPVAVAYADLLVGVGIERGVIGPAEGSRIWERHLFNCAALTDHIPHSCRVFDIGSGAGLPGVALAIADPTLSLLLVEPSQRRAGFLTECIEGLGLRGVAVHRERAEASRLQNVAGLADVVTSRGLARLDRLASWCLPLCTRRGRVMAIKGAGARAEVERHAVALRHLGAGDVHIRQCGVDLLDPPTTVVVMSRTQSRGAARPGPAQTRGWEERGAQQ